MIHDIHENGTISDRQKGDIYWRKQLLTFRASDPQTVDGCDFTNYPPTAVGRDIARDDLAKEPNSRDANSTKLDALPEEDRLFSRVIPPMQLRKYDGYLHENYISSLLKDSLIARGYYADQDCTPESLLGLMIMGSHGKWVELVYLVLDDSAKNSASAEKLMRFVLNEIKDDGKYIGVFLEAHPGEVADGMRQILERTGMKLYTRKNNNYEFDFRDIVKDSSIMAAAKKLKCLPLSALDDDAKERIEDALYDSQTPVPIALPVSWSNYDPDISFAFAGGDQGHGLILASRAADTIVVDLLYGSKSIICAALIGAAVSAGEELLGGEQKMMAPIVVDASRRLIERLVPNARRGNITEAIMWF